MTKTAFLIETTEHTTAIQKRFQVCSYATMMTLHEPRCTSEIPARFNYFSFQINNYASICMHKRGKVQPAQ